MSCNIENTEENVDERNISSLSLLLRSCAEEAAGERDECGRDSGKAEIK